MCTATSPPVHDGNLDYWNLFDAMVDTMYWAMEKVGCIFRCGGERHDLNCIGPRPDWPLMANVYPYYAYAAQPGKFSKEYALFTAQSPPVRDGNLDYWCLFDAIVDSFYSAMERVGGANVGIVVSKSGWPSAGNGAYITPDLAKLYNNNLIKHMAPKGTPKRPNSRLDTFVFAMFNENLKPGLNRTGGYSIPTCKDPSCHVRSTRLMLGNQQGRVHNKIYTLCSRALRKRRLLAQRFCREEQLMASHRMSCTTAMALFIFFHYCISSTSAKYPMGVCYGMQGNNLPAPVDVINLFRQYGIERIRIYDPNTDVLQALKGSKLLVSLGVRNEDIPNLSRSQEAANSWVSTFVSAYTPDVEFKYISVGNEVIPGENAQYVAQAIQNVHNALAAAGIRTIKVSTVVAGVALATSSPPSQGAFTSEAMSAMTLVVSVLSSMGSPLMVNVYPYFAYAADPAHISLPFATFTAGSPPVHDGNLAYWNLFDAMVDAFYWATEKVGGTNVDIVVTETGWPTAGNGNFTSPTLAQVYNTNLKNHVKNNGTPKRPSSQIDTYIFAMFNENLKQPGIEQNWGIFFPDKKPVYPLF
ncbi:hypothetical protein AAC387_Pa11g1967 [Persea americana]